MRRLKSTDRLFKGSVFVTYDCRPTCEAFVANDVNKFGDTDIIKKMQDEYYTTKHEAIRKQRAEDKAAKQAKKMAERDTKGGGDKPEVDDKPGTNNNKRKRDRGGGRGGRGGGRGGRGAKKFRSDGTKPEGKKTVFKDDDDDDSDGEKTNGKAATEAKAEPASSNGDVKVDEVPVAGHD